MVGFLSKGHHSGMNFSNKIDVFYLLLRVSFHLRGLLHTIHKYQLRSISFFFPASVSSTPFNLEALRLISAHDNTKNLIAKSSCINRSSFITGVVKYPIPCSDYQ